MEITFVNPGVDYMIQSIMHFHAEGEAEFWSEPLYHFYPQLDKAYDDFILDLGLFGHVYHSACFVHSPGGTYAEVAGFDNLPYPEYDANDGTFTVEEPGEFGYQKYLIMEDELLPAN